MQSPWEHPWHCKQSQPTTGFSGSPHMFGSPVHKCLLESQLGIEGTYSSLNLLSNNSCTIVPRLPSTMDLSHLVSMHGIARWT